MASAQILKSSPHGWYYIGASKSIQAPKFVTVAEEEIVVYRGENGHFYAVQSRCPHMGAALNKAKVRGNSLQCSLHQWTYNNQGKCTGIPGSTQESIPEFAKLDVYSIEERHGHLFVHSKRNEVRTLPFFQNENPNDYSCAHVRLLKGNNHWSVPAANAFDLAHFEYVHHRKPTAPPIIDKSEQQKRGIKLQYEILGKEAADKWLVKKYGKNAQLDYTVYEGNLIVAKTTVGKFTNHMMVFIEAEGDKWKAWLFVLSKTNNHLLSKIKNEISAYFSYQFFAKECLELDGVTISPERLGPKDELLRDYMNWLTTL
ncbi:MAG: Rieske (2Fe-2S) protein [Bacteriovoracaceae bacterium]|nr:Rieske (2Fe-2S) protein [Bacteriovoracaceae bacterium]